MKVSVVLPVYNAAATLRQAVESVLAQDFQEFELLVIDDGSSDESPAIIAEYAAADRRLRPLSNHVNRGLSASLNDALRNASGEYVVRMDADDESLPERLEVQVDFMDRHSGVAVAGSYVFYMGARRELDQLVTFPTGTATIREILSTENCIYHPTVIMRRREILALGGYRTDFRNSEDYELWLRTRKVYSLDNIPRPLLRYRVSVGGQTSARRADQLFYFLLAKALDDERSGSMSEARRDAAEAMARIDRKAFLAETGLSTIADLVRLRLWRDARRAARRLWREAGPATTFRVLVMIAAAAMRSLLGRRRAAAGPARA